MTTPAPTVVRRRGLSEVESPPREGPISDSIGA